jgi:hypothetical protein
MLIGAFWLSNLLGLTAIDLGALLITYWPILLIGQGLGEIRDRGRVGASPIILILLGLLILGGNLGWHAWNLLQVWRVLFPLLLMFIGWQVLRTASHPEGAHWVVMSGLERRHPGWELRNGSYVVLLGGVDLDLTVAKLPQEGELQLLVVLGGIDLRLPADLRLEGEGSILFGGIDSATEADGGIYVQKSFVMGPEEGEKRLKLKYRVVLGGIDIKRVY